ncbi:hemagluttinin domain-containing protein [Stenotrophomonas sp. ESTM1D_MKCIP4_1]|uniref:ESPR-type extended signal peptide-containing protein n=1 Tax=Stenotrophomonas sp. ESTM1D_MKCIP4_1 TaxID=2072414 RepID=UPI000D53D1A9|nr:ESPR-type extended signal peptide-containing protein [Stenotrophomonas sp. ESTM1D_MKCIP4_1]AWH54564.1 hemagluttinin domain-containing protein [Stenotrophomonas sp. ESTM1D_MKCIP4_1]
MNKIYRRLWSSARQCWVVTSELASPRGKPASTLRRQATLALLLSACPVLQAAAANDAIFIECSRYDVLLNCVPTWGHDSEFQQVLATMRSGHFLAMGNGATVDGSYSIGFGHRVSMQGDRIAAFGYGAAAKQGYSTVVGAYASSNGIGTVAIGHWTNANTENSIAVGSNASTASGAGVSRIAIGGNAKAGTDGWTGAVALGGNAKASHDSIALGHQAETTASGAIAMGRDAKASAVGSIALGHNSQATEANTVSVGTSTSKRRIVNIQNARLSSDSTDAVTGQQLYATNQRLDTVNGLVSQTASNGQIRIGAANTGNVVTISNKDGALRYLNGVRNGTISATSNDAVNGQQLFATRQVLDPLVKLVAGGAMGGKENARAQGEGALAMGAEAIANGNHATALGLDAQATANQATAIGRQSRASGVFSAALGNNAQATAQSALALGDRAVASHSGSVALGLQSQTTGSNQVSVGNSGLKRRIVNVADGAVNASSHDAVTGRQLNATNVDVASVRAVATTAQTAAAAAKVAADDALGKANALGGLVSQAGGDGNVRLGGSNTGTVLDVRNQSNTNRTLVGLADGAVNATSTEAVTGRQLQATHDRIDTAQSRANAAHSSATAAQATANQAKIKADATGNALATAGAIEDRNRATATGNLAMALGQAAKADGVAAFAMGNSANATGDNAMSLGSASSATAKAAVALGGNAKARHENSVALGERSETSGANEVSVGNAATDLKRRIVNVDEAGLTDSSNDAVTGKQLFATNEKVQANAGVLAGHTRDLAAQSGHIADNRRDLDALRSEFEDFDPDLDHVVKISADGSVDIAGGKLRGVAAGDISSATSTDAVNGGQLFATNERIGSIERLNQFLSIGAGGDQDASIAGQISVAIGDSALASPKGEGAVSVGAYSAALGDNSVAIGRAASVRENADSAFALGTQSLIEASGGLALGARSRVSTGAFGSVALGNFSVADEPGTVSVGHSTLQRRITNVSDGKSLTDASTISQLGAAVRALGGDAKVDANGNIIAPNYNVQGGTQNNVGDALAALDSAVVTADSRVDSLEGKLRSAFLDGPSVRADGLNQLALAGAHGSVLTNLADGRIAAGSRDAVTGSQLFEAKQEIDRNRSDLDDLRGERDELLSHGMMAAGQGNVIDYGGARLTGVADGVISADSRDVVNGRQLFASNQRIAGLESGKRFIAISSDDESVNAKAGGFSTAIGDGARAGGVTAEGATAVGFYATALAGNSIALGSSSYVLPDAEYGFALGATSEVHSRHGLALGTRALVLEGADGSAALGSGSIAREMGVISVGSDNTRRRIVNVANGRNATDVATVGQLRGALATVGGDIDANGNIINPSFNVQGGQQSTLTDALSTLDSAVVTSSNRVDRVESQLNAVFQDTPTVRNDGLNQLTFAGANGMVLSNVANGAIAAGSRDAVNGGQLHSMQQQLNGRMDGLEHRIDGQPQSRTLATVAGDEPSAPTPPANAGDKALADTGNAPKSSPQPQADAPKPEAPTPQVDTAELEKMLARANEYSDGISREVDARLDKMDKRFNRMAAMTSAQSAMAMNTAGLNTYNRLGAGVGYSEGESAMAVGYQRVLNDKGSATFSLNGAFTNSGERSMGVGVGIGW